MDLNMLAPLLQQFMGGNNANEKERLIAMAVPVIMALIQSHPGGLAGLIQQFENSGMAPQVQSWLGNGQNLPATPAQIQQAVTPQQMAQVTQQTGAQHPEIAAILSAFLPQIMDHLTPNGAVPHDTAVNQNLSALQGLLGQFAGGMPQAAAG